MRATRVNLTTTPQRVFPGDKNRGIFMCRNTDAIILTYVQFGSPSSDADGFPILPGDTLTLDRGDLSQEIYMWGSAATANNQIMVG